MSLSRYLIYFVSGFGLIFFVACSSGSDNKKSDDTESSVSLETSVEIVGSDEFVSQTKQALYLLKTKANDAFLKIETYVGVIEQGERSGMWAAEDPPRYEVSDDTSFHSVTWYASTIAHDATHSELYHAYLQENGAPVPAEVWTGVAVENFCNAYQLSVLEAIDAPQSQIDYLGNHDGTHCDIDNDGDCDWDDYNARTW